MPFEVDKFILFVYELFFIDYYFFFFRSTGTEGSITMNGHERNLSSFRKLSAYIMQDNQLHGNLTVEESMKVATSLKLSKRVPKEEKEEVVSQ